MKTYLLLLLVLNLNPKKQTVEVVSTTPYESWTIESTVHISKAHPNAIVDRINTAQTIEGFGGCFNELGWEAIASLSKDIQTEIFKEFFTPQGGNFTICRMPIAANDFSIDWYSYNEVEDDFLMNNFEIKNDTKTLIPYINAAKKFNPDLKIWASPWSPPTWMKWNKHYACATSPSNISEQYQNSLPPNMQGAEGTNMFIQEEKYFKAYALYFEKFIQAYRDLGIKISMIMPQNEWNSCQNFPSCTWNTNGLTKFIGDYLGPAMHKEGVELMLGTMERPSALMVDSILSTNKAKKYITGVGFQWAGKDALPGVREKYPELKYYQTEQECGDGKNDWKHCVHSWELMKHYISNGVNSYFYWNMALPDGGISRWGWSQNSLVTINKTNKTFKYNYEYYLFKHLSHFVKPGAKFIKTSGDFTNLLAFENPDSSIVVIAHNNKDEIQKLIVNADGENFQINMKANSFYTLVFR